MSQPVTTVDQIVRLWLELQGHAAPRKSRLTRSRFTALLEQVGALQLDSINVLDRAHYLTLWSRFGAYDRAEVDRWVARDRVAYEYWGHEASLLPVSHLPLGRRRMRQFPDPAWQANSWWQRFQTSTASRRRVLKRLRDEGPLESSDFTAPPRRGPAGPPVASVLTTKEDARSLKLLWHAGKAAIRERRHFRCIYDLAERVYPEGEPATPTAYADHWLLGALRANGPAPERHLVNYFTAPALRAPERRRVIARNLKRGAVVPVQVKGRDEPFLALPEHVERLSAPLPAPEGTTLICPFDSLLWQRRRADELLGFRYRVEIYVPPAKREHGYYVMPILHDGRLVGRLDPKLHRNEGVLEIRGLGLEPGVARDARLERGLGTALASLGDFAGARRLELPRGWRRLV